MTTRKKMTKAEAIEKLIETRKLSTAMLEPLGFSFESFLKLSQLHEPAREKVVADLVAYYKSDDKGKAEMVKAARQ